MIWQRTGLRLAAGVASMGFALLVAAAEPDASPSVLAGDDYPVYVWGSTPVVVFPPSSLDPNPPYIADPQAARFGFLVRRVTEPDFANAGDSRFGLRLGGRLGLLHGGAGDPAAGGWQFSFEGGFNGEFDTDNSEDNLGWDGIYGLALTTALHPEWRLKLGFSHWSSHVGDEYMQRTGRTRIDYTRSEFNAGASWLFARYWRTYGEIGRAYGLLNRELQEPGRVQWGLEYEAPRVPWDGRLGWFAAADLSAFEERDWRADRTLQVGLVMRAGPRHWRLGLEYHDGRPAIGEFFMLNETCWTLGFWMEL